MLKVGDTYPVWWETNDGQPSGQHRAVILAILPYTGRYDYDCVLRLTAPRTRRGWLEMAVKCG